MSLFTTTWSAIPQNATPDALVYDSGSIDLRDKANGSMLDLSGGVRRFWRFPRNTLRPMLASLFHRIHRIGYIPSTELRLAIRLRSLLVLRDLRADGSSGTSAVIEDQSGKCQRHSKIMMGLSVVNTRLVSCQEALISILMPLFSSRQLVYPDG
jgi:hypothetical protein